MTKRMGYALLMTALTGSVFVTACGDDDAISGGEAGEAGMSGSSGTSGSGGTGVSGSSVGGQGAAAGQDPVGGVGNAGESSGGMAGGGAGGSNGEAAGGGDAQAGASTGDGGAGGAADPGLGYVCGKSTIAHTYCSAVASVTCDATKGCSDCVDAVVQEQEPYQDCATCLAWWNKGYQCGIDAFEAGNTSAGLQCYEGDGVFLADVCYEPQSAADDCNDYVFANGTCPATWPLE